MKLGFSQSIKNIYNTQKHIHPKSLSPTEILRSSRLIVGEPDKKKREGLLLQDARLLNEALVIRMSRALEMIRHIPQAAESREIQNLVRDHAAWFASVCASPPVVDAASHAAFLSVLSELQHPPGHVILQQFATIGRQFAAEGPHSYVQSSLQSLCRRRMVWQLMVANHVALCNGTSAGVFSDTINPFHVVNACTQSVRCQCAQSLGCSPQFVVTGDTITSLTHVEPNISFLISELLKNAARATAMHHASLMATHQKSAADPLPPVQVSIMNSLTVPSGYSPPTITVTISDEGGGIPKGLEVTAWDFGSTTATIDPMHEAPIAGFGVGLPLSKLFAEQFGGSLSLKSSPKGCVAVFEHPVKGKEMFFVDSTRIPTDDDV
eukprot:GILI01026906.1.p1 GENE.GILI01026906.1~~GILI01026906.1.p1  ORF type:complete len:379 (-),score=38.86 GILI01026906.1:40-1176(-)